MALIAAGLVLTYSVIVRYFLASLLRRVSFACCDGIGGCPMAARYRLGATHLPRNHNDPGFYYGEFIQVLGG